MPSPPFGQWLYDWQTLIGSGLAVAAAGVSVWYLRRQIGQAEQHEQRRLRRRLAASRAILPLTLSGVIGYAEAACAALREFHEAANGEERIPVGVPLSSPDAPVQLIPALERTIEATDDIVVSRRLADLISLIQILASRTSDITARSPHVSELKDWIVTLILHAGTIHAQVSSLFPYARRQTDTISDELSWADVETALNEMGMWDNTYPDVWARIANHRKQGHLASG